MHLIVETITALRAQGVPADAVLDAIQIALTKRVEEERERARERQQRSRARRRVSAPACHSDIRDPSLSPLVPPGQKEKNQKKKPNPPIIPPEPSLSLSPAEPELTTTTTTYLPSDWNFREEHIHAAQAGCEVKSERMVIEKVKAHQPGFLRDFAERYVAEQAVVFRRWAQGWRRGAVNWDDQFHEWLRVGFAKLGKRRSPSLTHEGNVLTLAEMIGSFYAAKTQAESREMERMDPNYEARMAERARKEAEQAENERRWSMTDAERQAEHEAEKRRTDMKWWADRAEGFRKTLTPEKLDEWLRNVPVPDMLPEWCRKKLKAMSS